MSNYKVTLEVTHLMVVGATSSVEANDFAEATTKAMAGVIALETDAAKNAGQSISVKIVGVELTPDTVVETIEDSPGTPTEFVHDPEPEPSSDYTPYSARQSIVGDNNVQAGGDIVEAPVTETETEDTYVPYGSGGSTTTDIDSWEEDDDQYEEEDDEYYDEYADDDYYCEDPACDYDGSSPGPSQSAINTGRVLFDTDETTDTDGYVSYRQRFGVEDGFVPASALADVESTPEPKVLDNGYVPYAQLKVTT